MRPNEYKAGLARIATRRPAILIEAFGLGNMGYRSMVSFGHILLSLAGTGALVHFRNRN